MSRGWQNQSYGQPRFRIVRSKSAWSAPACATLSRIAEPMTGRECHNLYRYVWSAHACVWLRLGCMPMPIVVHETACSRVSTPRHCARDSGGLNPDFGKTVERKMIEGRL